MGPCPDVKGLLLLKLISPAESSNRTAYNHSKDHSKTILRHSFGAPRETKAVQKLLLHLGYWIFPFVVFQ
uniref:Ovule protein n=1 Tax=Steinernema glaseri TaxID=37863 RepID=A0A1I7YU94_9BILA